MNICSHLVISSHVRVLPWQQEDMTLMCEGARPGTLLSTLEVKAWCTVVGGCTFAIVCVQGLAQP